MTRLPLRTAVLVFVLFASASLAARPYLALDPTHGQLAFQTPGGSGVMTNVAVFDINGDGRLDILWSMTEGTGLRLDLSRSDDDLFFEDGALEVGLPTDGPSANTLGVGDFDGDGITDLFIGLAGQDCLFLGQPDGTVLEVTATHLPGDSRVSSAAAVADFDGDGDLDIYVGAYVTVLRFPFHFGGRNQLLVNDGSGRFTDRAQDWGLDDAGSALAAAWSDADEDGDLDLLVINDFGPHWYPHSAFRNDGPDADGDWVFTDVSAEWGFDRGLYGMGVGIVDADRDGHLDYYLTSIGRHVLLAGPANPTLTERTDAMGVANTFGVNAHRSSWGAVPIDATGDGYDDLYVRAGTIPAASEIATSNAQVDRLWALDEFDQLVDQAPVHFPDYNNRAGRGIVAADLDGDGSADLIGAASNDATRIYVGGGDPDPIHLTLETTQTGPGAAGARIWLTCGNNRARNLRQIYAGGSLGSSPPPGQEWLPVPGSCSGSPLLHVAWPSGAHSVLPVDAGDDVAVVEPDWLQLEPSALPAGSDSLATLLVSPIGQDGELLGAGHTLGVSFDDGRASQILSDVGDGVYETQIAAPEEAGPVRLALSLAGERLPVTRDLFGIAPDAVDWRVYPSRLIEGRPALVTVQAAEEVLGLTIDGASQVAVEQGAGWARFEWSPPEREVSAVLQVTVAGEAYGEARAMWVHPPISVPRSQLETYFAFAWTDIERATVFTLSPVDENGEPAVLSPSGVRVLEDGTELSFSFFQLSGARVRITPSRSLTAGSEVVIEADGVAWPPIPIREVSDTADSVAAVSPEHTALGAYFEGCRADGSDILTVSLLPRTPEDQPLPQDLPVSFAVEGGELIGAPTSSRLGHFKANVRCGLEPGLGRVELLLDGEPSGIEMDFRLHDPLHADLDPHNTDMTVPSTSIAFGEPASVRVRVRDIDVELAGSGVPVAVLVDEVDTYELAYCGAGAYCVDLYGPPEGAVWTLQPVVDGVVVVDTGIIHFLAADDPPAGDAGRDADAGGHDMGGSDAADVSPGDVAQDTALDAVDEIDDEVVESDLRDDLVADLEPDAPHGGDPDVEAPDSTDRGSDSADPIDAPASGDAESDPGDGSSEASSCGCGVNSDAGQGGVPIWWVTALALLGWRRRSLTA